eukprot:2349212-Rhodomonas_salina.1
MQVDGLPEALPFNSGRTKPDGLAQNESEQHCWLLEFARSSDFWPDSLSLAHQRKHDKVGYVRLQSDLRAALPNTNVRLLTFILGYRGLVDENLWTNHLTRLGLPTIKHRGFFDLAIPGAYKLTEDILRVQKARLKTLASAGHIK